MAKEKDTKAPETDKVPEAKEETKAPEETITVPKGHVLLKEPLKLDEYFSGDNCQFSGQKIKDGDKTLPKDLASAWKVPLAE